MSVGSGSRLLDLAVKRNGDVVACFYDNKVKLVSEKGLVKTLLETGTFLPCGMCLTKTDEIVLCMREAYDNPNNHLALYSADGTEKVREIQVKDVQGKQLLPNPYRVAMTGDGFLVVNDGMNVVKFDSNGRVDWIYGGSKKKLRKTFYPRGICVDESSNIFISDYDNCCVHFIDKNGCLIDIILKNELRKMATWGICFQPGSGEIWVGNGLNTRILVASYLFS